MSWEKALAHALRRAEATGRHWYVHGYRTLLGEWRYGAYREYRPDLVGRRWT